MRRTGTNLPKVGQYNRAVVLDQIQLADGISRVEIAELTGLTPQTVSGIVRRLIGEGIVREDGATISNGGKPRTLLRVNAGAGLAVGVHFDPSQLSCVVADLLGHPLAKLQQPVRPGAGPTEVVEAVAHLVSAVLARADVPVDRVLGLGIATPGPIDQTLGALVGPPQLPGWTRVPLKEMLASATGLPVTLDNDATAAAIGECWAGAGRGVADFAYFFFGAGVGGGLILGHQVHRGGSMNAAEFGHQSVQPDGPPCYCGNHGCLETLISPKALVTATGLEDYEAVRRAATAGDPVATAAVEAAAAHLATAVVNVANILDIDLVVLGGHGLRHLEAHFRDAVAHALATRPLARGIHPVRVEVSPLGADAAVVGAAALVLHTTYAPQVADLLSL
ncbi:ROK family transcriptional regulator [Actinoplanes regularis]|uniref:ROK family transcriptional regulator n=1 Tax=Actinoplanes regularis TaxID=52697 RepID=UPI0024A166CE|nr:ROK family transcriptional regulator [Actinoplanes regularis]GLW36003.1 sugar kinase [Actinoplanes regularis]